MNMIPKISDSEWEVMKVLWKEHPLTSDEIIEKLGDKMNWSNQTIKTFLTRLNKKEVISFDKKGRSYYYYPILNENECKRCETKSFLKRVYDGTVSMLISNFIQDKEITIDEINEIEKILNEKKNELEKDDK